MIIKKNKDEFTAYLEDTSNIPGDAQILFIPQDKDEVREALAQCSKSSVPVTCSAGRTGTTGGCVPQKGALLSLEKLNRISFIDKNRFLARVQSGVTLDELTQALKKQGLCLKAQPTESLAFVGGAVSTSASGMRGFKYGGIRRYVTGLEIVLIDGTVLSLKRGEIKAKQRNFDFEKQGRRFKFYLPSYTMPQVKHQAGYFVKDNMDLIDLFIGSEGTLGVITEIELSLQKLPAHIFDCVVFFDDEAKSLDFVDRIKKLKRKGEVDPVSLEYFDFPSLQFMSQSYPEVSKYQAAVYFEDETEKDVDSAVEAWLERIEESGALAENTWFGDTEQERKKIFDFRHALPQKINEFLKEHKQQKVSCDIAVPGENFREMYYFYAQKAQSSGVPYLNFGHIGEEHLHFNFLPRNQAEGKKAKDQAEQFVRKAVSLGGTISAEHGIGKIKTRYLEIMYGKEHIREMADLKRYFDPQCLLGRNNIFPAKYCSLL